MHTLQIGHIFAHFNSDFSGDIEIWENDGQKAPKQIGKMPFIIFIAVVGEKLRREGIKKLEEMNAEEVVYNLLCDGDEER